MYTHAKQGFGINRFLHFQHGHILQRMQKFLKSEEKLSYSLVFGGVEKIKQDLVFKVGFREFYNLKGKYPHKVVSLSRTSHNCPRGVSFPKCEKLFVEQCEKNFFFFFVNKKNFPKLKELWLNSHPCESNIFYEGIEKIVLVDYYERYKKWAKCPNTVIAFATTQEFLNEREKYFQNFEKI